jgi:hypothetical protein
VVIRLGNLRSGPRNAYHYPLTVLLFEVTAKLSSSSHVLPERRSASFRSYFEFSNFWFLAIFPISECHDQLNYVVERKIYLF